MTDSRPNILIYLCDQQRGDHLSIADHPQVETPNVDAFVNNGAYFPHAYSEVPSTTAVHRMLLSGKGPYYCGQVGYSTAEWHERETVAKILADNDYHCFCIGCRNIAPRRKLHGFHQVISFNGGDYDEFLMRELGPTAHPFGHGVNNNGWGARPWHLEERFHPVNWTVDRTLEAIDKHDPTRPFFIWCAQMPPHSPYCPPQVYWDQYADLDPGAPAIGDWAAKYDLPQPGLAAETWRGRLTDRQWRRMRIGYMACCAHVDAELGRLMFAMNKLGVLNNTLIFYISDHGDMQGDHFLFRKSYAYEGSARIPFLLRYPRGFDLPKGRCEKLVGLQDVAPTILDAAGVARPEAMTGRSVLAALRGEPWKEFVHGEHSPCYHPTNGMHYLTDAKEKYIWFPVTGEEQFFDLREDPQELHDLGKRPECASRVAFWRQRLVEYLADRPDGFSDGKRLILKPKGWSPLASKGGNDEPVTIEGVRM